MEDAINREGRIWDSLSIRNVVNVEVG